MYLGDFDDKIPFFGDNSGDYLKEFWHAKLAPYVVKTTQANIQFDATDIYTNAVRRCPGGSYDPVPYGKGSWASSSGYWNCWIGANFSYGLPPAFQFSSSFYYALIGSSLNAPLKASRIKKPSDALTYMDTLSHYVYSPVEPAFNFSLDMNGDWVPDSMPQYPDVPFNNARPTVHNDGSNVTLLDGHVERVSFKKLWAVDKSKKVTHSFWYVDD